MSYAKLIEWCYKKIDTKKKLRRAKVSLWFLEKKGKRSQKEKREHAVEAEINPFKLAAKKVFKGLISQNWKTECLDQG